MPANELRADAVPLPLDEPVLAIAERLRRAFERRREEERVGLRRIRAPSSVATIAANHSADGVQSPISRAAIVVASLPAAIARARTTSVCATPTRNSPVSSLFRRKRSARGSPSHHCVTCARCAAGRPSAAAAAGPRPRWRAADPARAVPAAPRRARAPRARRNLPPPSSTRRAAIRAAVTSCAHCAQPGRRDDALQPAAGQEEDRPGGVGRRRVAEIRRQRRHLGVRRRRLVDRLVERAEPLHRLLLRRCRRTVAWAPHALVASSGSCSLRSF